MRPVIWYSTKPEPIRAVIAGSAVVLFALFVFFASVFHIQYIAQCTLVPYEKSRMVVNNYMDTLTKPGSLDARYFSVFRAQQKLLDTRTTHYKKVGVIFFRNYYANLVVTIIFSCLGGLMLFILVSRGWTDATMPMKGTFLTISVVLTFSGLFPAVFNQENNFKENIKYYMDYQQAQVSIMNQLSYFNGKDTLNWSHVADSIINVNTIRINELTNYVLTINAKELKNPGDVYRALNLAKDSALIR